MELEEKLISFKTAKLAKNFGFDLETNYAKVNYGLRAKTVSEKDEIAFYIHPQNHNKYNHRVSITTLGTMQKWIKVKYDVDLLVYMDAHIDNPYYIKMHYVDDNGLNSKNFKGNYKTYDEALEQGFIDFFNTKTMERT